MTLSVSVDSKKIPELDLTLPGERGRCEFPNPRDWSLKEQARCIWGSTWLEWLLRRGTKLRGWDPYSEGWLPSGKRVAETA
ncbi:MAG: hypothetical protein QXL67_00145 [Candidatus Bathyarchaeia archaeon]